MVPRPFCLFLAVLTYFSFVSTFAWMTVMAFDICCSFRYSSIKQNLREQKYSLKDSSVLGFRILDIPQETEGN